MQSWRDTQAVFTAQHDKSGLNPDQQIIQKSNPPAYVRGIFVREPSPDSGWGGRMCASSHAVEGCDLPSRSVWEPARPRGGFPIGG